MVYKEHGMWVVPEVLRHLRRGESQVVIEAAAGRGCKTIRSYLRRAGTLGWTPGSQEPDEDGIASGLAGAIVPRSRR